LVLVASLATSFYAAHRVSLLRTRHAEASGRLVRPPVVAHGEFMVTEKESF
jgi:hypothetical protein